MGLIVQMRGALDTFELEEGFHQTAMELNIAASKGMEFMATKDVQGRNILIKLDNILTLVEKEDDEQELRTGLIG